MPDLIATIADDWLGNMFLDMAAKYDIPSASPARSRNRRCPSSCRTTASAPSCAAATTITCTPFPALDLTGCRALHLDGHQPDAAIHYAQRCRDAGILTSLDGGGLRTNTHELLAFIDVAMVAERFCEQMDMTPEAMLDYLKSRGCKIGGVTQGERGVLWYDESGEVRSLPALPVPPGGCATPAAPATCSTAPMSIPISSIPRKGWEEHFRFAQRAAPTRSSISATRPACRRSRRSRTCRASSIRRPATSRARRAKTSPRCAAGADRTASSSSRTGQRRRQFGCSVTVPGTLT